MFKNYKAMCDHCIKMCNIRVVCLFFSMKNINNNSTVVSYNASKDKYIIYKDNLCKSGIYRLNNKANNKSYVG